MTSFEETMGGWRASFDEALAATVAQRYSGEGPAVEAVRYALLAGGKRVRPLLCLLTNSALGGDTAPAMPAALALEFVHTYSLIHDDLPCMDNDDLRRGKPTVHRVYGEAQALLAGDALLTDAFAILSGSEDDVIPPATRLAMVRELSAAAGGAGMVLGQSLDLFWTARAKPSRADLDRIHRHKTGRLLGSSAGLGALAAGATPGVVACFRAFGEDLGLAFQILDDILDDSSATGKSSGKDKNSGKLTYLHLMDEATARAAAKACSERALAHLDGLITKDSALVAFVYWLLERRF